MRERLSLRRRKYVLLYNLTFPKDGVCDVCELYFRGGEQRKNGVFLSDGNTVTFDTYFNSFSHVKYKKYTNVRTVTLRLSLVGSGTVQVLRYISDDERELLVRKRVSGDCELTFDISNIPDKGFIYFSFTADGDCMLNGGSWTSDVQKRHIKLGIVICTYKREDYLRRNIAHMQEYARSLDERFFDVFVVDNARTVTDDFGEGFTVIPNDNTGGSGGFTRGIKEVYSRGYTHFLLMDDDILFDVNILQRTAAMLAALKDEYKTASIGGAMLVLDCPYLQKELGADWEDNLISSRRHRLDARNASTICGNEEDIEPNYNGWFYMCMPTSSVEKYGYPLPFFIRCDDIEYSLRAAEHIIVTSGIAVWHESFDNKYSPEMEYYIKRNELILSSRYPNGTGFFANWKKLFLGIGKTLLLQRYFAADLRFKAYDDFLKGADYFLNLDSGANHMELRKYCPRFLTKEEIKTEYGIEINDNPPTSLTDWGAKDVVSLVEYFIPKCFFKKDIAVVDMTRYRISDFFMKKKVLHYNPLSGKGFVTEIKKSAIFKYSFKAFGYFFKMLFNYRRVAKEFAAIDTKTL